MDEPIVAQRRVSTLPRSRIGDAVPGLETAIALLTALRPRQWVKNLLVFAAPGAAGLLFGADVLERTGLAFVVFCLSASAGYLVNDVLDAEQDRSHPTKHRRPVASGALPANVAVAAAAVLFAGGLALAVPLGGAFLLVTVGYVGVTLLYSLALKQVAVVDLFLVASCYVLRAVGGAAAIRVDPSTWFLALVTSAALAVVAGKRIADVRFGGDTPRPRAAAYPLEYLRGVWILTLGIAVTTYCLWSVDVPHASHGIAWSQMSIVPFALALFRYAYVIERGGAGEPEEVFATDRVIQVAVLAWALVYGLGVYLR